jgi:hypothetical protein
VLRLRFRTAAGGITLLLLAGLGASSGRLSAAPSATKQTTVHFSVSEKGPRTPHPGQELTRASGSGTLTFAEAPKAVVVNRSTAATGTITFHRWRVVNGSIVDEDKVTTSVVSGLYRITAPAQGIQVQVKVTTTDPQSKDPCPAGSMGQFNLLHGRVKKQPDSFGLSLCGLHDDSFGGVGGKRAFVTVSVKSQ